MGQGVGQVKTDQNGSNAYKGSPHCSIFPNEFVQDDLAFLNGKVAITTAFTVLHLLPSVLQVFNQPDHDTSTIHHSRLACKVICDITSSRLITSTITCPQCYPFLEAASLNHNIFSVDQHSCTGQIALMF